MAIQYQNPVYKSLSDEVYEPSEDSFLLIDALVIDLEYLKAKNPLFCLEVGSGSGVVLTALGLELPQMFCISTDINRTACIMSKDTASRNNVIMEVCNMDLAGSFIDKKFDIIICNPPYVVTESEECGHADISASWAGGIKGREIIDRLLHMIPKKLADDGVFYLLLIKDNIPDEVIAIMSEYGYRWKIVMKRRAWNEEQLVLKFYK